ncbi:tegument protein UL37 [Leporid alphaherpesvirus 4]|uniref:Tegument protein UL37 n=1 Tax=Leporid alphaherpesvirus 4 TaxID=481315 RepID=J9QYP0_9ALPH|nr:tegument protein UL37 [Leporid alphaherpesvirus 4]AFR32478.1 tegument protein UL37 [Leporid alphaherpesvirus 4]
MAPVRGPLWLFADTLDALIVDQDAAELQHDPGARNDGRAFLLTAKLRSAMAAFMLSPAAISTAEATECWGRLLGRLGEFHAALGLPETALFAENLAGFVIQRLGATLPERPADAIAAMEEVRACVRDITAAETAARLESFGLRASSPLGPTSMRLSVDEWIDRWRATVESCVSLDPRSSPRAAAGPSIKMAPLPLGQPGRALVSPKYSLLFPAPFVQEGLACLAHISNWVSLFSTHLQRIDDAALTPLTRVLFTLSLVDEYFAGKDAGSVPEHILTQFQSDVVAVDQSLLISPIEANRMPRSREEVRVSSALNRRSPQSTCAPPGMLLARIRTDAALFDANPPFVSPEALAIFQPAVSAFLQRGDALSESAQRQLLSMLQQTWTLLQTTPVPSNVISTLINAGFTPLNCKHYLAALESFMAAGPENPDLSEIQQLFGCISLLGSSVFVLAREYGHYVDYVKTFKRLQGSGEQLHVQLISAVGLGGGALSQTLARVMGPALPNEHMASLRRTIVGEFEAAERRFSAGRPSLLRETALLWVDVYGQTHWDVAPQMQHTNNPVAALLSVDHKTHSGAVLRAAAAKIRFPMLETVSPAVLSDPGFSPYVMAIVIGDALATACGAAFLPAPLTFASQVLSWARDFGLGYMQTVDGHRAKLGALITLLEPAARRGEIPSMQIAENVERILRELYASVRAAEAQIFPASRGPRVPPPEIGNSLLLISMYALAARGVLGSMAERADALAQQLEDAVVSLRLHTQTLAAFFECKFESDGQRLYALPGTGKRLGPWRPPEAADAVSQYCGMYHDAKRALTTAIAGLRSVIVEATAHRATCDELAAQISVEDNVIAKVLQEISTFLMLVSDMHARASRLLSGGHVPGFVPMGQFMSRWRRLSASYKAVQSALGPEQVSAFAQELHATWIHLQDERVPEGPHSAILPEQREAAVDEIMAHVTGTPGSPPADAQLSVITSRCNLGAWGDYDTGPLGRDTVAPESVDLSPRGLTVLLGMEWLLMQELLQITDGVFRSSTIRKVIAPVRDIEVRELGSAAMDHDPPSTAPLAGANQPEESDYDMAM